MDCGDGAINFPLQQNVGVVRGLSNDVQGKILRTQREDSDEYPRLAS